MHLFIIIFLVALITLEVFHYFKVTKPSAGSKKNFKHIFKHSLINSLYPVSILFIVFIPYIIVFFFDFNSIDLHKILLLMMWMPLYSYLFYLTGRKIFLFLFAIPLILFGITDILFWMTIGGPLTQENMLGILQSNTTEVEGFLSTNFELNKILVAGLFLIISVFLLIKEKKTEIIKIKSISISVLFFIIISLLVYKTTYSELEDIYPRVHAALIRYYNETSSLADFMAKRKYPLDKIEAVPYNTSKKQLYVLIIGESTSRNHMSLYNYNRNTNPLLKARNDIFVFNDVISAFSNTRRQLSSSLTLADYQTVDSFYLYPSLLDIAHKAGFKTYWISNQDPLGFIENQITLFSKTADETYFVKLELNYSNAKSNVPYDEAVIPLFKKVLEDDEEKKFIILHLMGTHMPYHKRYPPAFNVFRDFSSNKEKIICEYDNSIMYNDYIVNEIFNITDSYSQDNTIAAALYLSDHGQEVYDLPSDYVGHGSNPTNRFQIEIPFIVWLSGPYIKERPDISSEITSATNYLYMTDELNHSWLHLMGIESPFFVKEKSLFSKNYKPGKRIVYGKDYDLVMKNNPSMSLQLQHSK